MVVVAGWWSWVVVVVVVAGWWSWAVVAAVAGGWSCVNVVVVAGGWSWLMVVVVVQRAPVAIRSTAEAPGRWATAQAKHSCHGQNDMTGAGYSAHAKDSIMRHMDTD
jgi:hypothetical protein